MVKTDVSIACPTKYNRSNEVVSSCSGWYGEPCEKLDTCAFKPFGYCQLNPEEGGVIGDVSWCPDLFFSHCEEFKGRCSYRKKSLGTGKK